MKRFTVILTLLVLFAVTLLPISANSAEPPSFTLMVIGAPADLAVSIETPDGQTLQLHKSVTAWESYFKFYYSDMPNSPHSFDGMSLLLESGGVVGKQPLPSDALETYNNLLTFDWEKQSLSIGQPAWRVPLLVAMRVVLTFVIEGVVFFLFGYRDKRSWLTFAIVNLITQTALNLTITGPVLLGYWMLGFILAEAVIFTVEAVVYSKVLTEHKPRAVTYAMVANAASLVIGAVVISNLPV